MDGIEKHSGNIANVVRVQKKERKPYNGFQQQTMCKILMLKAKDEFCDTRIITRLTSSFFHDLYKKRASDVNSFSVFFQITC